MSHSFTKIFLMTAALGSLTVVSAAQADELRESGFNVAQSLFAAPPPRPGGHGPRPGVAPQPGGRQPGAGGQNPQPGTGGHGPRPGAAPQPSTGPRPGTRPQPSTGPRPGTRPQPSTGPRPGTAAHGPRPGTINHGPRPTTGAPGPRPGIGHSGHGSAGQVAPSYSRGSRTYTQREVNRNGQRYVERNDNRLGHPQFFRHQDWGNHHFFGYSSYYNYSSIFWGYYYSPFGFDYAYSWQWYNSPWYASSRWYYQPYTSYNTQPWYWVTDYVVGAFLADAANALLGGSESTASSERSGITAQMQQQLSDEVKLMGQSFQNGQSYTLAQAFDSPGFIFIVDTQITVAADQGETECVLSNGDLLVVSGHPQVGDDQADMSVIATRGGSCAAGTIVTVSYTDLQEQLNSLSANVDEGMSRLSTMKSKGEIRPR